jgi:hypothetical protein
MPASREARPTIRFVDEYCQLYEELFPEVRSFEAFKFLYLGMISDQTQIATCDCEGWWLGQSTKPTSLFNRLSLECPATATETTGVSSQGTEWQESDSVNR